MQFEERNQYTQASYISGTIYEWNIDGMTEYNILTKLQKIIMVSTTYKLNNRLPDHAVAQTIVAGFTGQLKGWWDNYLLKEVIKNMTNLPIKIYIIKKCGSTKEKFLFPFDFDFKNNL